MKEYNLQNFKGQKIHQFKFPKHKNSNLLAKKGQNHHTIS